MSKESDKIAEALENISITFDELGFSPTIPISKGDKAHFVEWFRREVGTIKAVCEQQQQRIAELEEQLKKAIVPKFKIGQEVWFVRYFNAGCYEFDYGKVIQIKITEYDGIFYEMEYLNKCEIDFRSRHEKYVFATKEEAQAKLEELRGENK